MRSCIHVLASLMLANGLAMAAAVPRNSNSSFCVSQPATPIQQKLLFNAFVRKLFVEKNVEEAYHTYVAEDLLEHDPFVASGAQASVDSLNMILPGSELVIYHQTFEFENSTGWVHTKASGGSFFGNQTGLADLYRFDGSCIVEHWDLYQMRPANATNPAALF